MLQRDLLPGVLANVQEVVQNIMNDEFSKVRLLILFSHATLRVVQCFVGKTERPVNWNIHLAFTWALGLALRYLILFPLRFFLLLAFTLIFLGMFFLVKLWPRSAARKRVLVWDKAVTVVLEASLNPAMASLLLLPYMLNVHPRCH